MMRLSNLTIPASHTRGYPPAGFDTLLWLGAMVVLWGLSWPATRIALDSVPPLWLAALRFGSAGACLFIFVALKGRLRLPPKADLPIVFSMGFLQMMTFTGLGMIAMTHIDTSRAVLLAYTTPLWGVVITALVFKRKPSRIQGLALAMGMIGIGLICSPLEMDWTAPGAVMGAAFLLVGAISWAITIVHIKHHQWSATPLELAPWQMLLATVPLAFFAYTLEGSPASIDYSGDLLSVLVFIGPIATSACFVISSEHGRRISAFAMSNFTLGVPVIGILSSVVFLGSQISTMFAIGLGFVFAAMVFTISTGSRS